MSNVLLPGGRWRLTLSRPVLPSGKAYERLLTSIDGASSPSMEFRFAMLVSELSAFLEERSHCVDQL